MIATSACRSEADRRAADERAKAEQAEKARQEQARADEFKRRDEEAAARHALQYPDVQTIENPAFEARRTILAKLAENPRAVKPKKVSPPDPGEVFSTYEYELPGLGEVIQWRTDASDWTLFARSAVPELFAPPGGLKELITGGPVSWWRVTAGPFDHGFVSTNPGGVEVRSMRSVCNGQPKLVALVTECNRY